MLNMPQKQTLFVQFIAITERPIVDKAMPWRKKLSLVADLILNLNLITGRAMVFVLFVVTKL